MHAEIDTYVRALEELEAGLREYLKAHHTCADDLPFELLVVRALGPIQKAREALLPVLPQYQVPVEPSPPPPVPEPKRKPGRPKKPSDPVPIQEVPPDDGPGF